MRHYAAIKEAVDEMGSYHEYERMDSIVVLNTLLGYKGEVEDIDAPGEKSVFRSFSRLWRLNSVPFPQAEDNEILQAVLAKAGLPSTPKPDITYGYTSTSFDKHELSLLKILPANALVLSEEPWFPYWIIEWKAGIPGGRLEEANTQARRDGAAAVYSMYNFYKSLDIEPTPEITAVFTACIDSSQIRLRVHWRNELQDGTISYEADWIDAGFLFKEDDMFRTRSIIQNILHWARDTRLPAIKSALASGSAYLLSTQGSPKKSAQKSPVKSNTAYVSSKSTLKRVKVADDPSLTSNSMQPPITPAIHASLMTSQMLPPIFPSGRAGLTTSPIPPPTPPASNYTGPRKRQRTDANTGGDEQDELA